MGTHHLAWWQQVPEVPARNGKPAHFRSSAMCHFARLFLPACLQCSPSRRCLFSSPGCAGDLAVRVFGRFLVLYRLCNRLSVSGPLIVGCRPRPQCQKWI